MKPLPKLQSFAAFLVLLIIGLWLLRFVISTIFFNFDWMMPSFYLLIGFVWLGVHLWFASGVMRDAARLNGNPQSGAFFVEPLAWGLATLVGGLLVVAMYWIFHYSTLRR